MSGEWRVANRHSLLAFRPSPPRDLPVTAFCGA